MFVVFFFFQAEDGIRDLVRSRGLGDVYKRQQATANTGARVQPIDRESIDSCVDYNRAAGADITLSLIHI